MDNLLEAAVILRRIFLLVITVYLIIAALLYFFQESLIFFRQPLNAGRQQYIEQNYKQVEEVGLKTHDGKDLHGWLVKSDGNGPSPLLIYFGGNAEEVSWMIEEAGGLKGWSVLLMNYRGYGKSTGRPGETALLGDALLLYDVFSNRDDIDRNNIAVMGRSLGTAMAVHLSARRDVSKTVLVSPFGSMANIARENFPFIPVRILMRQKFHVLPFAQEAYNPMLTLVASNDNIVPARHSKMLYEAWQGAKSYHVIRNTNHNTISANPAFWEYVTAFLERAGSPDL
ncbi:MAG: hypothetical protein EA408_03645 [Marinilabiliales bacterium]|nr:MAG: hypothetical protein EA408_03645 [Marinilabiliales bacterium]